MFNELGLKIDKVFSQEKISDLDLELLLKSINTFCNQLTLTSSNHIDYGRYLAYKSSECNIQVDVFSKAYIGQVHNHGTWGILGIIHGNFLIRDYSSSFNKLVKIRTNLASKGLTTYFPQIADIHSLESIEGPQGITIHAYGKDFDMDIGMRYTQKSGIWESYTRSNLREFKEIESNFKIVDI